MSADNNANIISPSLFYAGCSLTIISVYFMSSLSGPVTVLEEFLSPVCRCEVIDL